MGRKKVENQTIKESEPKKRSESEIKKSPITTLSNNHKIRWDKVKGVKGNIIRFKVGEGEERKEFLSKKNYRQLSVGIDGNDLYFYYEIME